MYLLNLLLGRNVPGHKNSCKPFVLIGYCQNIYCQFQNIHWLCTSTCKLIQKYIYDFPSKNIFSISEPMERSSIVEYNKMAAYSLLAPQSLKV